MEAVGKSRLPYVFVLDWDGTIAGKVDFQSARFSMGKSMARFGYKLTQKGIPKAFMPNQGLIRPGFAAFIRALKEHYGNILFFIYTASDRQWALQEIPWVEKSHGIQFQRPIFTREDCVIDAQGNYRKKLQNIWPRIVRVLNARHGSPYSKADKEHILNEQTLLIDNNAVYTDRTDRLLLCPDYHYMVFEDLLEGFPEHAMEHPTVQQQIYHWINEGLICPYSVSHRWPTAPAGMAAGGAPAPAPEHHVKDPMTRMTKQYEWYTHKCKSILHANRPYQHDIFWPYLKKLILKNNLSTFSRSVIQQLQNAVWKQTRKVGFPTGVAPNAPNPTLK
jgi:hypothetical protein